MHPWLSTSWLVWLLLVALRTANAQALPATVLDALRAAGVPTQDVSVLVAPVGLTATPLLNHQAQAPLNPASTMKLVTTFAALDALGPNFQWRTPVWLNGTVAHGVLKGDLVIQGQGDPKLVVERLWLLLRRVQSLGVRAIDGDIVLDEQAFAATASDAGEFDGEPLRPYNAAPAALLVNFKSLIMTFTPDQALGVARVHYDPPLWNVRRPATVPLTTRRESLCGDYRAALQADFSDPQQIRFAGSYPASCAEKVWPLAYSDPASYNARAIRGLWQAMGATLRGTVRQGRAPLAAPTFELLSPSLAEIVHDINKFSNNVMAQQVFLTLGRVAAPPTAAPAAPATLAASRAFVQYWWQQRIAFGDPNLAVPSWPAPVLDNGAGLSRQSRISAASLARLLQVAYASPLMPELMASLPLVGVDGTLTRSQARPMSAHLKTGSLKDVLALAGYVHTPDGRLFCLVAMVNHANARAAKPAMDALIDWTAAQ